MSLPPPPSAPTRGRCCCGICLLVWGGIYRICHPVRSQCPLSTVIISGRSGRSLFVFLITNQTWVHVYRWIPLYMINHSGLNNGIHSGNLFRPGVTIIHSLCTRSLNPKTNRPPEDIRSVPPSVDMRLLCVLWFTDSHCFGRNADEEPGWKVSVAWMWKRSRVAWSWSSMIPWGRWFSPQSNSTNLQGDVILIETSYSRVRMLYLYRCIWYSAGLGDMPYRIEQCVYYSADNCTNTTNVQLRNTMWP